MNKSTKVIIIVFLIFILMTLVINFLIAYFYFFDDIIPLFSSFNDLIFDFHNYDKIFLVFNVVFLIAFSSYSVRQLAIFISLKNSTKLFWILYLIRACILLYCYYYISPGIIAIEFWINIVMGVVLSIVNSIGRVFQASSVDKQISLAKEKALTASVECIQCNALCRPSDLFCSNCGANLYNFKLDAPQKIVSSTDFDDIYSFNENKMLKQLINRELVKLGINKSFKLIPSKLLKRKKTFNVIFSILIFVYISLIFFIFQFIHMLWE